MKIASEDDVALVRRAVRALAEAHRFDVFASAAITTATSELTRNVWVHARGGVALIEEVLDDQRVGIRVTFRDEGPGSTTSIAFSPEDTVRRSRWASASPGVGVWSTSFVSIPRPGAGRASKS
jgi:anti-sigma regulatory factor (Ser/Thr protein kinase)